MRMRAGAVMIVLVVLSTMTGCGPGAGGRPTPAAPGPSRESGSPTVDELVVTVRDASGRTTRWRLTCDPPGGSHPDPELACRVLEQHGAVALRPVSKDRRCTQVYGGPETATITGRWHGRPVSSRLSRTDGCEIGRWDALVGLLPRAGG